MMPIAPQDSGPDDWFVPEADGYPNDWFVPASAAPATTQPAPDPQLGTANPALTTRPASPPDPLADYWSRVPAGRVGQWLGTRRSSSTLPGNLRSGCRTLCRNCAVKFLSIQDLAATEQTEILRNFLK
jgi:hypothetical protein